MFGHIGRSLVAGAALAFLLSAGCGSPFLHPAVTPALAISDPGLVGSWATEAPMDARAEIVPTQSDGSPPQYQLTLTVRDKGEVTSTVILELMLTSIGSTQYADLFLARPERDALVGKYGFLVLPVHQIMKLSRDGDTMRVWSFQGDWVASQAQPGFSYDRVAVGGGDASIITARTDKIRELLARHGEDARLFGDPMVFHRALPGR